MGVGRVTQIMGPVIDVRFEHNEVPNINNALFLEVEREDGTHTRRRCRSYDCYGLNRRRKTWC